MSKRVVIYTAEDCRTLYAQGEPYSNDRPNGWQDMAFIHLELLWRKWMIGGLAWHHIGHARSKSK